MSKVKIELNSAGIKEMLLSSEMEELLAERAREIQSRCGNGYETDTHRTPGRMVASVFTDSDEAKRDNSENNTILRALR